MPPWTLGWSVFTRPPSISGAPVKSCTWVTLMPSCASSAAVPPVERISIPSADRPQAKSTSPVLSDTLISARATVMTRLHTTATLPRMSASPPPRAGARASSAHRIWGCGCAGRWNCTASSGSEGRRTRSPCRWTSPTPSSPLFVFVVREPGLVVRDHPQLRQPAHLELAHALAGQVHDHADLLERDARAVGDVQRAGLRQLPQLLVGEVHLHRPGARVDVDVEVVLAGDVRAGTLALRAVAALLRPGGVQLRHQALQLRIDSSRGGLLPEEPGHLLAAHGPRPLARLVLRPLDDGENVALRLAHKSVTPSRALPVR